jgi:hypothetical protein
LDSQISFEPRTVISVILNQISRKELTRHYWLSSLYSALPLPRQADQAEQAVGCSLCDIYFCGSKLHAAFGHGLRMPGEEIAFTARPKINSHSQIIRYGQSKFCLSHMPKFSDFFNLCLHWVFVVRDFGQHARSSDFTCHHYSFRGYWTFPFTLFFFCFNTFRHWIYFYKVFLNTFGMILG